MMGCITPALPTSLNVSNATLRWDIWILSFASWRYWRQPSCGAVAFAHLVGYLEPDTDLTAMDIIYYHQVMQRIDQLLAISEHIGHFPFGRGPASTMQEQHLLSTLRPLLVSKGVRMFSAVKRIGINDLVNAAQSPQPWSALKALASRPNLSFRWLKADELQSKITLRAHSKFGVQPAEKKRKSRGKQQDAAPLYVNPALLTLIEDSFVDDKGQPVGQISFADIAPGKHGIAFGALNELTPFLKEGKTISDLALGVLTPVPIPQELHGSLIVTNLRFPAQYQATAEPMLVQGSLVLLGKVTITRKQPTNQLAHLQTQALRLTVYQDQWTASWTSFLERPIRALLEQAPVLQLCRADGCGTSCKRYHPPVDESIEALLLDVWSRCWLAANGRFCSPAEATHFSVMIWVPSSARLSVQLASGHNGLYVEPRSQCGKFADDSFGVIWLPNSSIPDIKHKLTTMANAICVCRMMGKYGLRFRQEHLAEAHATLKPSDTFIDSKISKIYKLYPLPHGTQRSGLQRLLASWGWAARVLHAAGGGSEGSAWEVGTAVDPPSTILQGSFGDVTVTLLRQTNQGPTATPILASLSTKRHIKTGQPSSSTTNPSTAVTDPWLQHDPWGGFQSQAKGPDRLQQFETRLKADVESQVRAQLSHGQGMEVDDHEATLASSSTSTKSKPPPAPNPTRLRCSIGKWNSSPRMWSTYARISAPRSLPFRMASMLYRTTWARALHTLRPCWRSDPGRRV